MDKCSNAATHERPGIFEVGPFKPKPFNSRRNLKSLVFLEDLTEISTSHLSHCAP